MKKIQITADEAATPQTNLKTLKTSKWTKDPFWEQLTKAMGAPERQNIVLAEKDGQKLNDINYTINQLVNSRKIQNAYAQSSAEIVNLYLAQEKKKKYSYLN